MNGFPFQQWMERSASLVYPQRTMLLQIQVINLGPNMILELKQFSSG
jgi:hypothetical protein